MNYNLDIYWNIILVIEGYVVIYLLRQIRAKVGKE